MSELRLASATTIGEAQAVIARFLPRFNARFAVAAQQPEPAWRPLDPALDLGAILAFRHTRSVARDNTVKYHPDAHAARRSCCRAGSAAAQLRRRARRGAGAPRRRTRGPSPGREHRLPARPTPLGVLRERRSELALDPALERVASGLGPSAGPPRPQAHPATTNGTIVNAAAPTSCARRPRGRRRAGRRFNRPSCRDSRCAPPPGCSASHATPSGGTSARRPTRVPGCGIIYGRPATKRTFSLNR